MLEQALLLIASYIANTMSALAGGGAGLIQLPALLWMGLPFPVALATHKVATVALGLGAMARLWREREIIQFKFGLFLLLVGCCGTIIGALAIVHVPDQIATTTLGVLIIALGVYSAFKKDMGQDYAPRNFNLRGHVIGGAAVFLIGVMNGSITAGSGLFVTLLLILYYGMDYKRAVAYTLAFVGLFWNATGAATLVLIGEPVHMPWLMILLVGAFAGGYTGSHLGLLKGNKVIKVAFVFVTLLSGVSLLLK